MDKERQITYCEAVREAIEQEMERDSSVFIYGVGVPKSGLCGRIN